MPLVVCRFHILPSASSTGYVVSFYPKPGEPDGWCLEAYAHIRGLARQLESAGTDEQRAWQKAVARRLCRQGVKLISPSEADTYERVWGRLWSLVWETPILRRIAFN